MFREFGQKSAEVSKQTHLLRDEVSSNLDVLLCNDPSVRRYNGVQPEINGNMFLIEIMYSTS